MVSAALITTLVCGRSGPVTQPVSLLIFRSGWRLTQDSARVLLEGTPPGFDAAAVEDLKLVGLRNVRSIHHIHAWSLTGETPIVTLHADCVDGADRHWCWKMSPAPCGDALAWSTSRSRLKTASAWMPHRSAIVTSHAPPSLPEPAHARNTGRVVCFAMMQQGFSMPGRACQHRRI